MFNIPYLFFLNPKKTIQLYNHVPNWWAWWVFIGTSAVLMAIQMSGTSVIFILFQLIMTLIALGVTGVFVDMMAQIFGAKGQFKQLVYWLGFTQAILWLSPLVVVIRGKFPIIGGILVIVLMITYYRHLFITVATVYKLTRLKTIALFLVPIAVIIAVVFIVTIAGIQFLIGMA